MKKRGFVSKLILSVGTENNSSMRMENFSFDLEPLVSRKARRRWENSQVSEQHFNLKLWQGWKVCSWGFWHFSGGLVGSRRRNFSTPMVMNRSARGYSQKSNGDGKCDNNFAWIFRINSSTLPLNFLTVFCFQIPARNFKMFFLPPVNFLNQISFLNECVFFLVPFLQCSGLWSVWMNTSFIANSDGNEWKLRGRSLRGSTRSWKERENEVNRWKFTYLFNINESEQEEEREN